MTARTAQIPKLIVQLGEIGLAAEGVRVERRVASPEPAVGVFTPARTCPGRLRCHCVIGSPTLDRTRLPSAPAATGFGGGSGPGSGAVGARCRPGSGDDDWGAARPGVGHDRGDASCVEAVPLGSRLASPDMVPRPGTAAMEGRGGVKELQINSLFCKLICKPDAARQHETGETEPTERDGIGLVRRVHHARERLPGTPETHVVWLITQRSRVQIPPPLLISAVQGPFPAGREPFARRAL
jgi:hypothetical protein